eukprot:1176978-Prorocentrum_minimum.AAC.2
MEMDGKLGGPYCMARETGVLIPNPSTKNDVRYVRSALGDLERLYCIFDNSELTGKYVPTDGGTSLKTYMHEGVEEHQSRNPALVRRAELAGGFREITRINM